MLSNPAPEAEGMLFLHLNRGRSGFCGKLPREQSRRPEPCDDLGGVGPGWANMRMLGSARARGPRASFRFLVKCHPRRRQATGSMSLGVPRALSAEHTSTFVILKVLLRLRHRVRALSPLDWKLAQAGSPCSACWGTAGFRRYLQDELMNKRKLRLTLACRVRS